MIDRSFCNSQLRRLSGLPGYNFLTDEAKIEVLDAMQKFFHVERFLEQAVDDLLHDPPRDGAGSPRCIQVCDILAMTHRQASGERPPLGCQECDYTGVLYVSVKRNGVELTGVKSCGCRAAVMRGKGN
jgi:hypothetical protein